MFAPNSDRAAPCLERSCRARDRDWIRAAPARPGFERLEAFFAGHAFDPHRHDTYVVGMTLHGVQAFRYRGASRRCLPGELFVLHPDETHDGHAGTVEGFQYRSVYIEPRLIQEALGVARGPLPFARVPVSRDCRLAAVIRLALDDLDRPLEDLHHDEILVGIADALAAVDSALPRRTLSVRHYRAVATARDFLDAHVGAMVTSSGLEAVTGLSRYALARHFRACLGTSPYRYLVMRRLDWVRALIRTGTPLAEAALATGFADQSHMTRHFKKAYGLSPGRWAKLAA
jgi:AraC-like DNA-binding protein